MNLKPSPRALQAKQENRQQLIDLIEQQAPFSNRNHLEEFKRICLERFDATTTRFSYYQLTTLLQVFVFSFLHNVKIDEVKAINTFSTEFTTNTHLLRVIYDSLEDTYNIYLTDKATNKTDSQSDVYFEDLAQFVQLMN
jgi:hypothetical protein